MSFKKRKYCILGTGGFGREVLTCLIDCYANTEYRIEDIAVFMVDDEFFEVQKIMGVPVIKMSEFTPDRYALVVAVGDPQLRKSIVDKLSKDVVYTTIIHPSAIVSKWVEMGEGCVVTAGTIVTCNIKIGKHAHLNLNSTIGHDCIIGDYFTTAPASNISGNCHFGDCVYFGTNSSVRHGITICSNVTIGMGGVVVKNIEEEGVYVGSPVKRLA